MKKLPFIFLALLLALLAAAPAGAARAPATPEDAVTNHSPARGPRGKVVVANRGSGSISVIDVRTHAVVGTYALPAGDQTPEPMYVTYSRRGENVFVGDRANDRVVVFDATSFDVVTTIPAGSGVFHMWSDRLDRQLWVNNDVDNSITVINPRSLSVMTTVNLPVDLVAAGYKPHDVVLGPLGRRAYVTLVGPGAADYVVQYDTRHFVELNRAAVGKDPHVSLTFRNSFLYVPAQNSNVVTVLNRFTLEPVVALDVPGAHGAAMAPNGRFFYTTNLPGGGTDGLFAIDTRTNTVIGSADTPFAVPHNVVVTRNRTLFLTHSGATSDSVTIYAVSNANPIPTLIGDVSVGLNPFGLAYVPGH